MSYTLQECGKAVANSNAPLIGRCFYTSVMPHATNSDFNLTGTLLDTGAASNFISRATVLQLGISIHQMLPIRFRLADGRLHEVHEYVYLELNVSGVEITCKACMLDNRVDCKLLIGMTALNQLLFHFKCLKKGGTLCRSPGWSTPGAASTFFKMDSTPRW